ncbi:hypothetical protein CAG99_06530 [Streptomyces marincola]|uniref:DUF3558 domain-containing protein n=1 Tax=Streptomyces marincola TaxID=2878388 RepID=A0A1W7CUZ1_9ACTN|nr:hypothetical protein CAG99_06530 [Streptomyces marincola]
MRRARARGPIWNCARSSWRPSARARTRWPTRSTTRAHRTTIRFLSALGAHETAHATPSRTQHVFTLGGTVGNPAFRSVRAKIALALPCLVLVMLTAASCSPSDEQPAPSEAPLISAERVCGGTLNEPAASDLRTLTGTQRFRESTVPSATPVDLEDFLTTLRASDFGHDNFCRIYLPQEKLDFATTAFGWTEEAPADFTPEPGHMLFETGASAFTDGNTTSIYFPCRAEGASGSVISARLYDSSQGAGPLQISILNSVSRAVADGLGCLEESGLVEGRPERLTG